MGNGSKRFHMEHLNFVDQVKLLSTLNRMFCSTGVQSYPRMAGVVQVLQTKQKPHLSLLRSLLKNRPGSCLIGPKTYTGACG